MPTLVLEWNTKNVELMLGALGNVLLRPERFMKACFAQAQFSYMENFIQKGRPVRWKDWATLTIKIKENRQKWTGKSPGDLLRDSGRLMAALGQANGAMDPGSPAGGDGYYQITDNEMTAGVIVDYAAKQNYGDPGGEPITEQVREHPYHRHAMSNVKSRKAYKPRRGMVEAHVRHTFTRPIPARPFLGWQQEDADLLAGILGQIINEEVAKVGHA